jgi:hypothetical protein
MNNVMIIVMYGDDRSKKAEMYPHRKLYDNDVSIRQKKKKKGVG